MSQENPSLPVLSLDDDAARWHIRVRCRSGFDGQLPILQNIVPDGDAIDAVVSALTAGGAHVVALVGSAGTGKTTAMAWLLKMASSAGVEMLGVRCARRTVADIQQFLRDSKIPNGRRWLLLDGLDEIIGEPPVSLDELLNPVSDLLAEGETRVVVSTRVEDVGRSLLVPPNQDLVNNLEWQDTWSGVRTLGGLRVAILRLQDLRPSDVELYARRRGLGADFVAHLRNLYDLRELVRRFFLLVKLCDLSTQLERDEWMAILDRNALYRKLLTTWIVVEQRRHPGRLQLDSDSLLAILASLAIHLTGWIDRAGETRLDRRVASVLREFAAARLRGEDPEIIANALVKAGIIDEGGFSHKSIEEYLLAHSLTEAIIRGRLEPFSDTRITSDVISFLAEDEEFRRWLDSYQGTPGRDRRYVPIIARVLHRQGRAMTALDLRDSDLSHLELSGMRLAAADLRGSNLTGTDLGPVDLTNADLRGATLSRVSVWSGSGAAALYPASDGQDSVWLERADGEERQLVLMRIGVGIGRVVAATRIEVRATKVIPDGRAIYTVPRTAYGTHVEAIRFGGERMAPEQFTLPKDALPLWSQIAPGAVWHICSNEVLLTNEGGLIRSSPHPNRSVNYVIAAPDSFKAFGIDGGCILGDSLWIVGPDRHEMIASDLPLISFLDQAVAFGKSRLLFRRGATWHSWLADTGATVEHDKLAAVTRVAAAGEGFILITHSEVQFTDDTLNVVAVKPADTQRWRHIAPVVRQRHRAVAVLVNEPSWLVLVDEESGIERPDWITLRAKGAKIDSSTRVDYRLQQALLASGAHDVGERLEIAALGRSQGSNDGQSRARTDVLLLTVNEHEFDAVMDLGRQHLQSEPKRLYGYRTYYDLGIRGGVHVTLVRSQMGSATPGGSATTVMQAVSELRPSWIIAVGIAFGVEPDRQPIGQILYSRQLQPYELRRVSTLDDGRMHMIPRGDRVTANPVFLDRIDDAASAWKGDLRPQGILMLSGDKLIDHIDYRNDLVTEFPDAKGGEMEGTGVYVASRENEGRWMIVKAVSDYADGQKRLSKEERQKQAAARAAEFVFFAIDRTGFQWSRP